jgi:hypothetical protein
MVRGHWKTVHYIWYQEHNLSLYVRMRMWLVSLHNSTLKGDSGYSFANCICGMLQRASALWGDCGTRAH